MKKIASLATAAILALTASCTMPEEDIKDGKHGFNEKGGNGAQKKDKAPAKPEGPQLSTAQESAVRSAQGYLDMSGMSRTGLIEQLKFEGFTVKDATFAVDHIKVNWNQEAVESAEGYLEMTGMSRTGLIEQLKFEGFTEPQAAYAATQVGL